VTVLLISVVLAFVLGFSAHRASICTVAAVAEMMSSRTVRVFSSFVKVILWVTLVNGLLVWWMPELARTATTDPLTLSSIVGGFLFGAGAAVNGGCSFSTLSKIAQGDLHVAFTLPAFVAGVVLASKVLPGTGMMDRAMSLPRLNDDLRTVLLGALALWALWEIGKIVLPNVRGAGIWRGLTSGRYRLSTGAALIGIGSGLLYALHGRWAYSSKIVDSFVERPGLQSASADMAIWLFVALLSGAIASALSAGEFKASFARDMAGRNLVGGFMMGFGAMMVPGGNAALLLQDLPALSIRALAAYAAMIAGIAVALFAVRRLMGAEMSVSCDGDFCRMRKHVPGKGEFAGRFGSRAVRADDEPRD
jgi:hypothetical protein